MTGAHNSRSDPTIIWKVILWVILLFLAEEAVRVASWVISWKGFLGVFLHGAVWYKLGELLIIAPVLILAVNLPTRDRKTLLASLSKSRWLVWLGAALNLAALLNLAQEGWWSPWIPILLVLGIFVPIVLKGLIIRWRVKQMQALTLILLGLFAFNYVVSWPTTGGLFIDLPTPRPSETQDRNELWRQDLRYLARELPRVHARPFFKTSESEFYAAVDELDRAIPELENHEIFVGMMKLTASLGDPHTNLWAWYGYQFRAYPLVVGWYAEGPFVRLVEEENKRYRHMRLTGIGKCDIDEAYRRVCELIPHTGEAILRSTSKDLLCRPEILHALGIIDHMDSCTFILQDSALNEHKVAVYPKDMNSIAWYRAALGHRPLWLESPETPYWYRVFDDDGLLYFKYNRCLEPYADGFSMFCSEMFDDVRNQNLRNIVVDFRRNSGGAETLFEDFMIELRKTPLIMEDGRLIGIIDYNASGAAVANAIGFQKETGAEFFGAPPDMDGSGWVDGGYFDLPNSGGTVYYSEVDPETYLSRTDSIIVNFPTLPVPYPECAKPELDYVMDSVVSYIRNLTDEQEATR